MTFFLTPLPSQAIKMSDFEIVAPISKGAFGRVFLAKKKATQDVYAIKVRNLSSDFYFFLFVL